MIMRILQLYFLTFQIVILLAHRPHTDLIVDHIDTRKAASQTKDNINVMSIF